MRLMQVNFRSKGTIHFLAIFLIVGTLSLTAHHFLFTASANVSIFSIFHHDILPHEENTDGHAFIASDENTISRISQKFHSPKLSHIPLVTWRLEEFEGLLQRKTTLLHKRTENVPRHVPLDLKTIFLI